MSTHDIEGRLARLAPTAPPDPERFAAAHAAVVRATSTHDATDGTGGPGRLLDPDDDRVRIDVVLPLEVARTRKRRNKAAALAAAAAGVVGIVTVALVLPPGPGPAPASPADSCRAQLDHGIAADDVAWRTVVDEEHGDAELVLLVGGEGGAYSGACTAVITDGGATSTVTTWPEGPGPVGPEEVVLGGTLDGRETGWHLAWGRLGSDVESLTAAVERADPGRDTGIADEATITEDGLWWVWFRERDLVGAETEEAGTAERSWLLSWTARDGSAHSLDLGDAWSTGLDDTASAARRSACLPSWRTAGYRPMVEDVADDLGVTFLVAGGPPGGRAVVCLQDVDAPWTPTLEASGPLTGPAPAADEAMPLFGGSSGDAVAFVGTAGTEVSRVAVRDADGRDLRVSLGGGYWVAWDAVSADLAESFTVTWYLTDGVQAGTTVWPDE